MSAELTRLREQAQTALKAGRDILDAYKEKALPPEKEAAAQKHFDEVDGLRNRIKLLEKQQGLDDWLSQPSTQVPLNNGKKNGEEGKGKENALTLPAISPEMKALAGFAGYREKQVRPTPFNLDLSQDSFRSYDPDQDIKHRVATAMYWKYGAANLDRALSMLPQTYKRQAQQMKDLATAPGGAGGYLVAPTMLMDLVEILGQVVAMRRLATVLPPIPGGAAIVPTEENELSDPEWTMEVGTGSDDTVEPFGRRNLTPHPLAKRVKVSRTLLRAATLLNVEQWVLNRQGRKFSEAEENGFLTGSGTQQPEGLLTNTDIVSTETAASNALNPDDVINWCYQLAARYLRRNPTILCNISFVRKVRLLRDESGGAGTGQYMWQPGLREGMPDLILDFPYEISDFYPTGLDGSDAFEDNAIVATIGDFSFYHIVDSLMYEVQRLEERYAENNQVGFIGRKETDGMVVKAEAFRHLKIKA